MDIIQSPDDQIDTDPVEMLPLLVNVLTSITMKKAIAVRKKKWPTKLETEMQEHVSALVAAARARDLETFDMIVIRPNGDRVVAKIDVARVAKTRTLQ